MKRAVAQETKQQTRLRGSREAGRKRGGDCDYHEAKGRLSFNSEYAEFRASEGYIG